MAIGNLLSVASIALLKRVGTPLKMFKQEQDID
jgi:hypothetical protein